MITHLRASEKQAEKTSSHDQTHDRRPPMITSTAGMAEIWRKRNSLCVGTKCPIATAVHAVRFTGLLNCRARPLHTHAASGFAAKQRRPESARMGMGAPRPAGPLYGCKVSRGFHTKQASFHVPTTTSITASSPSVNSLLVFLTHCQLTQSVSSFVGFSQGL